MARFPRLNIPNLPQHVIQRGNNKTQCFFADKDYYVYLKKLHKYLIEYNVTLHSYVLMTNHVHLLMSTETEDGISKVMQCLGRCYVRYINTTYERSGTLWEGRYKSSIIESNQYFITVSRYIEMNPVRADMVEHPGDYKWSSFTANGFGATNKIVTPHKCYLALGHNDNSRREQYLRFFETDVSEKSLKDIRMAINKSRVLGSESFKTCLKAKVKRIIEPGKNGGDRKSKLFKVSDGNQ